MNSSDTNYVNNGNLGQYHSNEIPSKIMPGYSYPASLVDEHSIPIELSRNELIWY